MKTFTIAKQHDLHRDEKSVNTIHVVIRSLKLTSHNRASRDCGLTVNTTIYPKGYAQSKCVTYIVTMRAGEG